MGAIDCRVLLFDWDGTLIDSMSRKVSNAGRAFGDILHCDPVQVEKAYRRYSGIPRRALFASIASALGKSPLAEEEYGRLSEHFSVLNRKAVRAEQLFPNVPPTLSALSRAGFTQMVSSSATSEEVKHAVTHTGLTRYFDTILGSEDGFGKGPEHVAFVSQQYEVPPWQICMIGDEPADIQLARKAGARSVARLGTHSRETLIACRPDALVHEISELPSLLRVVHQESAR